MTTLNRKPCIAGNWKMVGSRDRITQLMQALLGKMSELEHAEKVDIVICPPFPYLQWTGSFLGTEHNTLRTTFSDVTEHPPQFINENSDIKSWSNLDRRSDYGYQHTSTQHEDRTSTQNEDRRHDTDRRVGIERRSNLDRRADYANHNPSTAEEDQRSGVERRSGDRRVGERRLNIRSMNVDEPTVSEPSIGGRETVGHNINERNIDERNIDEHNIEGYSIDGRTIVASQIALGAQDVYFEPEGAFTGEVSSSMLIDFGCQYVIIGHSERRQLLQETDALIARKFRAAYDAGLIPILCVGETQAEREAGQTLDVVARQLEAVLKEAGPATFKRALLAYEPVWAIGTGLTATPDQAVEVHAFLRSLFKTGTEDYSNLVRILYGGSVKASNAADLFAKPDIDGALVGGASLNADEFLSICRSAVLSLHA